MRRRKCVEIALGGIQYQKMHLQPSKRVSANAVLIPFPHRAIWIFHHHHKEKQKKNLWRAKTDFSCCLLGFFSFLAPVSLKFQLWSR